MAAPAVAAASAGTASRASKHQGCGRRDSQSHERGPPWGRNIRKPFSIPGAVASKPQWVWYRAGGSPAQGPGGPFILMVRAQSPKAGRISNPRGEGFFPRPGGGSRLWGLHPILFSHPIFRFPMPSPDMPCHTTHFHSSHNHTHNTHTHNHLCTYPPPRPMQGNANQPQGKTAWLAPCHALPKLPRPATTKG